MRICVIATIAIVLSSDWVKGEAKGSDWGNRKEGQWVKDAPMP